MAKCVHSTILHIVKLLSLFAQNVNIEVLDLLWSEHVVFATALDDNAASHFEEHRTFEGLIKILSANHLSVIGQES